MKSRETKVSFFNWIWPILAVQVAQNLHATISFSDDDLEGWLDASLTSTAKCQPLCKWVWQEDTIYLKKYVAVRIALIWCNFTTRKKEKKAKGDRSTLGLMANEVKEATPDQIGRKCLRIIDSISYYFCSLIESWKDAEKGACDILVGTPWILAQKCGGIIGLWKKCILDNFDNQNQGRNNFWIPRLSFWGLSWHAPINPA